MVKGASGPGLAMRPDRRGRRRRRLRAAATVGPAVVLFGLFLWTHSKLHSLTWHRDPLDVGDQPDIVAAAGAGSAGGATTVAPLHDARGLASAAEGSGQASHRALPNPAIIIFCFNRTDYLNQTLHSLAGLEGLSRFAVYVSQDGGEERVAQVVAAAAPLLARRAARFAHWQKLPRVAALGPRQQGHAWLAQHYKWGMDRVFLEEGHSHVVVVEDDMIFSPGAAPNFLLPSLLVAGRRMRGT